MSNKEDMQTDCYTHYYTQNKIKEIPNGLIKDIKQLFKNVYKNKFKIIDKTNTYKISSFDNIYDDDIYIIRLNTKKIYIRIYCDWFIIDTKKSGKMSCNPDSSSSFYETIIKTLLILCIHYGVIENGWQDDRNQIYNPIMNKCKEELYKLGYTKINIKYENENYYSSMLKNK